MKYLKIFNDFEWDRIFDGSAALTYYFILAIFPGLLVTLSVISYVPAEIINSDNLYWVIKQTPGPVSDLILKVVKDVQGESKFGMFSISFLIAIWTVSNGVSAAVRQLNLSYKAKETRSVIKLQTTSILLSFAVGILVLTPILAVFLLKFTINYLPIATSGLMTFLVELLNLKYFLFFFLFFLLFQTIYHFGPNMNWNWKKHLPGSISMSALFVLVTQIFEVYLAKFADYSLIYGSVGAIVILMLWFNILGLVLILGGEINTKIDFNEHFKELNKDIANIIEG